MTAKRKHALIARWTVSVVESLQRKNTRYVTASPNNSTKAWDKFVSFPRGGKIRPGKRKFDTGGNKPQMMAKAPCKLRKDL
jgi:hypothetical protein